MTAFSRLTWLVLRQQRRSLGKLALLCALVAAGMCVFLTMNAMAKASSDGVQSAIEAESGATGTYRVDMSAPGQFGMTPGEASDLVKSAVDGFTSRPVLAADVLPQTAPDCPPFSTLGTPRLLVLRDADRAAVSLPFGQGLPENSQLCLGGLSVPSSALYMPNDAEKTIWGTDVLFLNARYENLVASTSTAPIGVNVLVVTGRDVPEKEEVLSRVSTAAQRRASTQFVPAENAVFVDRIDADSQIRAATAGVQALYSVMAWTILALAGVAVLVAQLMALRDKAWVLGLSRAVGATPGHLAVLVILEVVLVLLGAWLLTAVVVAALSPVLMSFSVEVLRAPIALIDPWGIAQLFLGSAGLLALGAGYPAALATRIDPADTLERR